MNDPVMPADSPQKLSELIYVELIGRAFLRADNEATIKPDPAKLAKLSLDLAEIFQKSEKVRFADSLPKNVGYDVQSMDLASLGTTKK